MRKPDDVVMARLEKLLDARAKIVEDEEGNERVLTVWERQRVMDLDKRIAEIQWVCGFRKQEPDI